MNIWKSIFALYLFTLSFAACVDTHAHCICEQEVVVASSDGNNHNTEICSPFCLCSCCQTLVTKVEKPNIPSLASPFCMEKKQYSQEYSLLFLCLIWEPPKV